MSWWESGNYQNFAQAICTVSGLSPGQYHYGHVLLAANSVYGAYGHRQRDYPRKGAETLALVGFWQMRWTVQLSSDLRIVLDFYPSSEISSNGYQKLTMEQIFVFHNQDAEQKTRDAMREADISLAIRNMSSVIFSVYEGKNNKINCATIHSSKGQTNIDPLLEARYLHVRDDVYLLVQVYPTGEFLPLGQANLEQAINDLLNGTSETDWGEGYKVEGNVQLLRKLLKREETALQVYLQLAERRKKKT